MDGEILNAWDRVRVYALKVSMTQANDLANTINKLEEAVLYMDKLIMQKIKQEGINHEL